MVSFLYFDRKYITNSSGGRGMTKTVQRETINYLPFINVTGTSHVAWKSSQLCYLTQTVLSFVFFCLPPAELLIFYLRKKRKKPWNLNQELKADHKLCSLLMKINSLRQKLTYLLFVQTCFLSLICFTFVQICIILYREHVAEYNNLKSKFILHNKI